MSHPHPSPATGNRQEDLGQFLNEGGLLFDRKHQVSVALALRGEGSEDSAVDTEIWCAHVRTLFRSGEAQGQPPKVFRIH